MSAATTVMRARTLATAGVAPKRVRCRWASFAMRRTSASTRRSTSGTGGAMRYSSRSRSDSLIATSTPTRRRAHWRAEARRVRAQRLHAQPRFGVVEMAEVERDDERVLAREVLVERTDRHSSGLGHVVGRRCRIAAVDEEVSSRVEDGFDGPPRIVLNWELACGGSRRRMRVARCEHCSHSCSMSSFTLATTC